VPRERLELSILAAVASKTTVYTIPPPGHYILKHTKGNAFLLSRYVGSCLVCFDMEEPRGIEPRLPG